MSDIGSRAATAPPQRAVDVQDVLRSWVRPEWQDEVPGEHDVLSGSAQLVLPLSYGDAGAEAPGMFPFTRGVSETMYREKLWVMGMYSGYASPLQTSARLKQLLSAGQTGFSVALDLPTQMGIASDDPLAAGEVGRVGLPMNSVEDLKALITGLPFDKVRQIRTTANAIGPIFVAFMLVALEELGIDPHGFRLMVQNDPLKEFAARGTFIFPPEPSLRFAVDVVEYFASHFPHWEPIEFCGYHYRDAGGTAIQEVALATADGIAYLDEAERRGVDIGALAPNLFLFLNANLDIFEEAAKFRAARRLWAKLLHERYDVPAERARMNIFAYTSGAALWAQEPMNNIVRVTLEALGAVLGGVQTMASTSYDEALGLPTEAAAHLALRTQQIIGYESGAARVVDPLGGSYYVESLTDRLESAIAAYVLRVLDAGGATAAISSGFVQRELAESSFAFQQDIESGERPIVGVNIHNADAADLTEVFRIPPGEEAEIVEGLARLRASRDPVAVARTLESVVAASRAGHNAIPFLIDAARARVTLDEVVGGLRSVWGSHRAAAVYQ